MTNLENSGKLVGAMLLGAAIGATLGVLFAPDKGVETRKKLRGKADKLSDSLRDKFEQLLVDAQLEIDDASEKSKSFLEKSKQ